MQTPSSEKLSKVEHLKIASQHLRGPVNTELKNQTDNFTEDAGQILKFHGIYQQTNRDIKKARKAQGLGPSYSFMIRVAIPGGLLSPTQYLALDDIADQLADTTMRLTTRQAIQYHGVVKGGLKPLMKILNTQLLTTLSACGDVVRNIMACPAPFTNNHRASIQQYAKQLSMRLKPQTRSYYELWLDGEKAASVEEVSVEEKEPLYGDTYLPRKFKIAFASPGDNCVDAYTQDIGVVPVINTNNELTAFTLLVGGGLGQSHGAKDTHPVLAKPLCTIATNQLTEVVEAIVKVQRDHGRRDDRKFSRMKYLVEAWGIKKFKTEVEKYCGFVLPTAQAVEWQSGEDHLGWHEQGDGKLFLGLFVENGRIKDNARIAIREVVQQFQTEVRLSAQQNILFANISPEQQEGINNIFKKHNVALPGEIPRLVQNAMACPALPTCSLAVTEAERVMPDVMRELDALWHNLNLQNTPTPFVRMTGCPNGCARPYSAEVGLVGRSLNSYTIYLAGSHLGTRLAQEYLDNVPREQLTAILEPILLHFKNNRHNNEHFGDFCNRIGLEKLQQQFVQQKLAASEATT